METQIPKIIHYCWLSDDPYPESIRQCIDSWRRCLPDYEIRLWDTHAFDVDSVLWTRQAFEAKKYAFAADYIRLYALYNFGGIYLDSDVLVYKSFDDLLDLPYFIGQDFVGAFEAAVIGCKKGMCWIKEILDSYSNQSFVLPDGSLNIRNLPVVFFEQLFSNYNFKRIHYKRDFDFNPRTITLFDKDYFNSRDNIDIIRTGKSYCSHKFAASWNGHGPSAKDRLAAVLPRWLMNAVLSFNYHILRKSIVHSYDPVYMKKKIIRH